MSSLTFWVLVTDSIVYLVALIIPLYLWSKNKREFLLYFFALSIDLILVYILKITINVPRPQNSLIPLPHSPSFPSTHASLGFFPLGFFFYKKKWRVPLLIYGSLISYSRVYLGVHYWLDIVVGAPVGFFIGLYFYQYRGKFYKFFSRISNKK
ncbi:MAG: phosphatase PAP2 family protein [Candidatus Aenigmarchaeota archaeon]|nr:phosphatase PAP2 family protein [Candidatus Aenigmarchaeota archaeon]